MLVAASTKIRSQDTAKGLFRHHNELSEMMTIQFVIDIHGARMRSGPQLGSNRHHHPPEREESFSIRYLMLPVSVLQVGCELLRASRVIRGLLARPSIHPPCQSHNILTNLLPCRQQMRRAFITNKSPTLDCNSLLFLLSFDLSSK